MKKILLIPCWLFFLATGCTYKKNMQIKNAPLSTVIKLQAAEFLMDYAEAKNYIDINRVYGGKNTTDSLSPEEAWIEMISFMSNSK